NIRLLRDGCRRSGSGCGTGDHHRHLSHARNTERRQGKPAQIMTPNLHLWIIPVLVLTGAAINGFFGKKFSKRVVSGVALCFCGAAFVKALFVWFQVMMTRDPHWAGVLPIPYTEHFAQWIQISGFHVEFGFYLDQLSLIMLMVVTGVGFLIHIY